MASSQVTPDGTLPVVSYVVLTFVWSWSWWLTAAVAGVSVTEPPGLLLYLLGVFGPLVGASWLVHRGGGAYRRVFLRRIWDPRGIPGRWWFALLAVAAGPALVAVVGHAAFNVAIGLIAGSTVRDVTAFLALTAASLAVVVGTRGRLGLPGAGGPDRPQRLDTGST